MSRRSYLNSKSGDPSAAEQLLPMIYDEFRKLAAAKLAIEKPRQTLQATALASYTHSLTGMLPSSIFGVSFIG